MKANKRRARFCPLLSPNPDVRRQLKQIARMFDVPIHLIAPPRHARW